VDTVYMPLVQCLCCTPLAGTVDNVFVLSVAGMCPVDMHSTYQHVCYSQIHQWHMLDMLTVVWTVYMCLVDSHHTVPVLVGTGTCLSHMEYTLWCH
jgi:hypothetical protein